MKLKTVWMAAVAAMTLLACLSGCVEPNSDANDGAANGATSPVGVYIGVVPEEMKESVMQAMEDMHARATTQEEKDEIRRQIDEGVTPLPETVLTLSESWEYSLSSDGRVLTEGSWTLEGEQITLFAVSMLDFESGEMVPTGAGPESEAKATWNRSESRVVLHGPSGDMVFELKSSQ